MNTTAVTITNAIPTGLWRRTNPDSRFCPDQIEAEVFVELSDGTSGNIWVSTRVIDGRHVAPSQPLIGLVVGVQPS